jgi:hypothetical protein
MSSTEQPAKLADPWSCPSWSRAAQEYHAERKMLARKARQQASEPLLNAEYVLAELRCLSLRARIIQADVDAIGLALKGGVISVDQAIDLITNDLEPAFDELPTAGGGS